MNKGYVEGSYYRGRILMSGYIDEPAETDVDPKEDIVPIDYATGLDPVQFSVRMDVYEGSEIPSISHRAKIQKMRVEVHLGRETMATTLRQPNKGRCKWYEIVEGINAGFCED